MTFKFQLREVIGNIITDFEPLILNLHNFYLHIEHKKKKFYWGLGETNYNGFLLGILFDKKYALRYFELKKMGLIFLYENKNKRINKKLIFLGMKKTMSYKEFHQKIGELANYPKCCVDNYVKLTENKGGFRSDIVARELLKNKENVFGITIFKNGDVQSLLQYIPCSPNCKESIRRLK